MIWLLVALQAADGLVTWWGIERRGGVVEGNPIVRWLMTAFGIGPALVLTRGAAASLSFYAATHFAFAAPLLIAVYAAVVIYNLRLVRAKED